MSHSLVWNGSGINDIYIYFGILNFFSCTVLFLFIWVSKHVHLYIPYLLVQIESHERDSLLWGIWGILFDSIVEIMKSYVLPDNFSDG